MDRDARQPGGKLCASGELPEVPIGTHVGILHHVFGLSVVPKNPSRDSVQALVIAPHDDLEQRGFAVQDPAHHFLIREWRSRRKNLGSGRLQILTSSLRSRSGRKGYIRLQSRTKRYVGTFRIRYPPTNAKITSGDHAASTGGSWLMLPMASNSPETTVYTTAMPIAVATPAVAPRFPADNANGIASTPITNVITGNASFFCS